MQRHGNNTKNSYTDSTDHFLFGVTLPKTKKCIQKQKKHRKYTFPEGKPFSFIEVKGKIPSYKPHLTIEIPKDTEVKPFIPVNRIRSISNCNDINELGFFHAALLKKGDYRRYNEDRVCYNEN